MAQRFETAGFLEKMLGPLPSSVQRTWPRWVGDPVRNHLALLLNSRMGSVSCLPDYGLPDVSTFYTDYPGSLTELRVLVQKLIEKYEPRLLNVRVRLIESDTAEFKASFLITGEIEADGESVVVQYRTTISNNGQIALDTP
jgi:type VI secretion system protein